MSKKSLRTIDRPQNWMSEKEVLVAEHILGLVPKSATLDRLKIDSEKLSRYSYNLKRRARSRNEEFLDIKVTDKVAGQPTLKPKHKTSISGNDGFVHLDMPLTSITPPRTKKELEQLCHIDGTEWLAENILYNSWPTSGFERDPKTGKVKPIQITNIQVRMGLKRKTPLPIEFDPISPVQFNINKPIKTKPPKREFGYGLAAILTDGHIGYRSRLDGSGTLECFHSREVLSIFLTACAEHKPEKIVLGGDFLDLADWNDKFLRPPDIKNHTQTSIVELGWYLSQLRLVCPDSEISFICGNHSDRLRKNIAQNMAHAYKLKSYEEVLSNGPHLLSIRNLLSLDSLNIGLYEEYPTSKVMINDQWMVMHGHRVKAGAPKSAEAMLSGHSSSVIFGHIHRCETATVRYNSSSRMAISAGCACKVDGTVPGSTGQEGWDQGFVLLNYEKEGSFAQPEIVRVIDGRSLIRGQIFESFNYLEGLIHDTGWSLLTSSS